MSKHIARIAEFERLQKRIKESQQTGRAVDFNLLIDTLTMLVAERLEELRRRPDPDDWGL